MLLSACAKETSSLVFYEITDDDFYGYPTGEIVVVDNTDTKITSITVPSIYNGKPVTLIGGGVFAGCRLLTEVKLPESIKYIESDAFAYCDSLANITLPDSLIFIGWGAFECDSELVSISFSKNVFRIAENAFRDCTKLQDIYFNGTQEDWGQVEIREGNECLLNANIHYNK